MRRKHDFSLFKFLIDILLIIVFLLFLILPLLLITNLKIKDVSLSSLGIERVAGVKNAR